MGDSALSDIPSLLKEPYNVLKDSARSLLAGNCLLEEYKSAKFAYEHDLVGTVMILPGSIICYHTETIVIYKRRT
jgi:hypothetical protein